MLPPVDGFKISVFAPCGSWKSTPSSMDSAKAAPGAAKRGAWQRRIPWTAPVTGFWFSIIDGNHSQIAVKSPRTNQTIIGLLTIALFPKGSVSFKNGVAGTQDVEVTGSTFLADVLWVLPQLNKNHLPGPSKKKVIAWSL